MRHFHVNSTNFVTVDLLGCLYLASSLALRSLQIPQVNIEYPVFLSTMSKSEIRSVGPYILQETLGRGQTGEIRRRFFFACKRETKYFT